MRPCGTHAYACRAPIRSSWSSQPVAGGAARISACLRMYRDVCRTEPVAVLIRRDVSWGSARARSQAVNFPAEISIPPQSLVQPDLCSRPKVVSRRVPSPPVIRITYCGDTGMYWNL